MSLKNWDASERMDLNVWNSTPSVDRRMMSASGLSKGGPALLMRGWCIFGRMMDEWK